MVCAGEHELWLYRGYASERTDPRWGTERRPAGLRYRQASSPSYSGAGVAEAHREPGTPAARTPRSRPSFSTASRYASAASVPLHPMTARRPISRIALTAVVAVLFVLVVGVGSGVADDGGQGVHRDHGRGLCSGASATSPWAAPRRVRRRSCRIRAATRSPPPHPPRPRSRRRSSTRATTFRPRPPQEPRRSSRSSMPTTTRAPSPTWRPSTRSTASRPVRPPTAVSKKVSQTGSTLKYPAGNSGWALEISLDVQTVRSICQSCHILLVEANSATDANLGAAENEAASLGAVVRSSTRAADPRAR